MTDGYLGRCKTCHKAEIHKNYLRRMSDPEWKDAERIRQLMKARRQREAKGIPFLGTYKRSKIYDVPWPLRNPEKRKAQTKVGNAIRDKKLFKQPCEKCGNEKVEAHHDDYSKPLDVRWLCKKHHVEHHMQMRRLERFTLDALNNTPA